jgi:actin-like protein 6A
MATQMLCGDEVRAAVVDFGSSSCKIGAAGQDTPRHVFRTDIGIVEDGADGLERYIVGDSALRIVRENMEITKPNKPGEYYTLLNISDR